MKKKIMLILILLLVVGCNDKKDFDKNTNKLENGQTVAAPKYEDNNLEIADNFEKVNGNVKDIGFDSDIVVTYDNKIYVDDLSSYEFVEQLDDNISQIVSEKTFVSAGYDLLQKDDGTYILYMEIGNRTKTKEKFKIDNLVYLYSYYAITLEDNYLYYYKIEDGKLDNNKKRLTIDIDYDYTGKVQLEYSNGRNVIFFKLENGIIIGSSSISESSISVWDHYSDGLDSSGNKIVKIYSDKVHSPIYSIENDEKNLYYSEIGNVKKFIEIPDGYTTKDIKNVYCNNLESIIVMNDGNVYSLKYGKLKLHEKLSELNKNSNIKRFTTGGLHINILCDDGYVYNID